MRFEQSESLVVETAEPAQHAPRKRLVHDIHQLRGVAILGVVLLHAIGMFIQVEMPPMAEGGLTWYASVLSTVLFHDFTILFTFISGVLYPWHAAGLTPASVFGGFISASAYVICVIAVSLGMSKAFHTVLGHRARLLVG